MNKKLILAGLTLLPLAVPAHTAFAATESAYASGRLIVFYKANTPSGRKQILSNSIATAQMRVSASGAHVLALPPGTSAQEAKQLAEELRAQPEVAMVAPDVIVRPTATASTVTPFAGPSYGDNASFLSVLSLSGSRQLLASLNSLPASVTVIDTGVAAHSQLPHLISPGYNFYTLFNNSRSAGGSDPGDGVSAAEAATLQFQNVGCTAHDSTWHGTAVAGIIGAQHSDVYHTEGVATGALILSARALGKCGGYLTDIIDAALWSAGVHVPGVPDNANPSRIINMSFGAHTPGNPNSCAPYQSAIDQLTAAGVVIVAAAGNDNEDTAEMLPANCSGVVTVTASNQNGNLASYSATGSNVVLAAPGGESNLGIITTSNSGILAPAAESASPYFGTSMSAAVVSGVVSMMLAVNPALPPANVAKVLKATASPMTSCPSNCGGGLLSADAAVRLAYEGVSYTGPTFPAVSIGASADSTAVVRNTSGLSVLFGGAVFGGLNATDFTKTADSCSGTTLNDGDSCSVAVRFAPTTAGQRSATLQIASNMPSMGISVPLSAGASASVSGSGGSQGSGGGGCAVAAMTVPADPIWLIVVALAFGQLVKRRRRI